MTNDDASTIPLNKAGDTDVGTADVDAFSISEFCQRHRISVQLFYKRRKEMPKTINIGSRVLISREAAKNWRRARARKSAETAA